MKRKAAVLIIFDGVNTFQIVPVIIVFIQKHMLRIYIRAGCPLDAWAAGSRSFMRFPVPEKRLRGTY